VDRRTSPTAPSLPARLTLDLGTRLAYLDDLGPIPLEDPRVFEAIAEVYTRSGWGARYSYGFAWFGRPVIQLPEDLVRLQEAVYALQPDVVIETGIAHGGSLVFYASLLRAIGHGRVIGIDVEIRPHNRQALEEHPLRSLFTLVEGSSLAAETVARVRGLVQPGERVFLVLDSAHGRDHVLAELEAYSGLLTVGDYIAVADGIMRDVVGLPRSQPDWDANNPASAVATFLQNHPEFERGTPPRPFDETSGLPDVVTYYRSGWLRRIG
jgi:cephalosporin hydroxylase